MARKLQVNQNHEVNRDSNRLLTSNTARLCILESDGRCSFPSELDLGFFSVSRAVVTCRRRLRPIVIQLT